MARSHKLDSPVAVVGLGRFGKSLALELVKEGVEVLGIDGDPKVVQSLASRLTHVVEADTTDEEAMRQLSVQDFDRAVLGIGIQLERGQMLDYADFDDGYAIVKTRHATPVTVGRHGDIVIVPGPQERVERFSELR